MKLPGTLKTLLIIPEGEEGGRGGGGGGGVRVGEGGTALFMPSVFRQEGSRFLCRRILMMIWIQSASWGLEKRHVAVNGANLY